METKEIYSCEEHVDVAFDKFLNDFEIYPYLTGTEDSKCSFCEKKAKYKLKDCSGDGESKLM